jgi:hypothetical protein
MEDTLKEFNKEDPLLPPRCVTSERTSLLTACHDMKSVEYNVKVFQRILSN